MEKNILYKKIRDKRATLREQDEFMEFLHEDGVITDEHYPAILRRRRQSLAAQSCPLVIFDLL